MTDMFLHPGVILVLGGCAMMFLPKALCKAATISLPVLALLGFLSLPGEFFLPVEIFNYQLSPLRIDGLSWIFTLIFIIAAFITALYSLHSHNRAEQATIPIYAGSAIGAVLAGDLLTLFVFWEISAIASIPGRRACVICLFISRRACCYCWAVFCIIRNISHSSLLRWD